MNTKQKKCIWCSRTSDSASFNKKAHTVPKSLGGQNICENVCDECNAFFGNHYKGYPSIETIIKETFIVTRARFLAGTNDIGRNKSMGKFSSIYFDIDLKRHKMKLKLSYKLKKGFQEKVGRQIKKGLYKIFLEETERQYGEGNNPKYDFIREFARYDFGDYPVFYFDRLHGIILMSTEWAKQPVLLLDPDDQFKYLVSEPGFFEFEFLGHVFGIATTRHWQLSFDNYIKKSVEAKHKFFRSWRMVNNFNDIDLTLSILDDKHRT